VLIDKGYVDAAIAAADRPMQRTYVWPYQMHGFDRPVLRGGGVRDDGVRVWSGTRIRDVVGAVAAICSGGLHPDHVDLVFPARCRQQSRDRRAGMRILGAGPHPNPIVPNIRHRAGRPIEPCIWYGQT